MAELDALFPESMPTGAGTAVAWEQIPAKGAVYLLACREEGELEKPLLLATVGDLRAALKRRLEEAPAEGRSKRVPYAQICTRIHWRRVDSSFAANWWYWRAARELFPETYKSLIAWRSSWWIGVERAGPFPKLKRTSDLSDPGMLYAGPIRDKSSAGKLIETLEDLFDLCRYHQELAQAPRGRPCAYKEMGKCPAPCDGSVPVAWYRGQMEKAWCFMTGETRAAWCREVEGAMKAAAGRLEFETAGKLKQRLARAAFAEMEPFCQLRPLGSFSFLALQPGKGKPWLEPWLIHGGQVMCLPQVQKKTAEAELGAVLTRFREWTATPIPPALGPAESEQVALVAHHLFRGENDHGIHLPTERVRAGGLATVLEAAATLWARKASPKPLVEQSNEQPPASAEESIQVPCENSLNAAPPADTH